MLWFPYRRILRHSIVWEPLLFDKKKSGKQSVLTSLLNRTAGKLRTCLFSDCRSLFPSLKEKGDLEIDSDMGIFLAVTVRGDSPFMMMDRLKKRFIKPDSLDRQGSELDSLHSYHESIYAISRTT